MEDAITTSADCLGLFWPENREESPLSVLYLIAVIPLLPAKSRSAYSIEAADSKNSGTPPGYSNSCLGLNDWASCLRYCLVKH